MITEDKITEAADLIRDIIETYTQHPEELLIDVKEHAAAGAVYFRVTAHGNDQPSLIGRMGSHVKALTRLVEEMGRAAGVVFNIVVPPPNVLRDKISLDKVRRRDTYDVLPAGALLVRILCALGLQEHNLQVDQVKDLSAPFQPLTFRFRITVRSQDDYARLTWNPPEPGEVLIGALGTLFRAYANKEGVKFTLEVRKS